jgi:hypothetical protein
VAKPITIVVPYFTSRYGFECLNGRWLGSVFKRNVGMDALPLVWIPQVARRKPCGGPLDYTSATKSALLSAPTARWFDRHPGANLLKRVNNRGPFYINGTPGADLGFSSGEVGGRASR